MHKKYNEVDHVVPRQEVTDACRCHHKDKKKKKKKTRLQLFLARVSQFTQDFLTGYKAEKNVKISDCLT